MYFISWSIDLNIQFMHATLKRKRNKTSFLGYSNSYCALSGWWPDILPKDSLPTDNLTNGLLAEKSFLRKDNMPKIEISSERQSFCDYKVLSIDFDDGYLM